MLYSPVAVSYDITFRCNLKCVMCHTWMKSKEITQDQELLSDQIVSISKDLHERYGVSIFRFLGGEPLLREDLPYIISSLSPFATTLITTNGTLLDEPICRKLIEAGVSGISISIDGPRENSDAVRGNGVYDKAVTGLKTLMRVKGELGSNLEVKIGNVVSKVNLYKMEEAISFANDLDVDWNFWPMHHLYSKAKETNLKGVSCGFLHSDPQRASELVLDNKEIKIFWKNYYKLIRKYKKPGSQKSKQGRFGQLKQFILHKTFNLFYRDCLRVGQHMLISSNGEIPPCEFLRAAPLGNVLDQNQEIWKTSSRISLEKTARDRSLPVCRECHRLALYRRHF